MSTLHENVSRRRAAEGADLLCATTGPGSSALVVHQWKGPSWVLPWSYLVAAKFTEGELTLSYTHCAVVVIGTHLSTLADDIAAFRVLAVRDLPPSYRTATDERLIHITKIEVKPAEPVRESPA